MLDPFVSLIVSLGLVLSTGVAIGADVNRWVLWALMLLSAMSVGVTVHAIVDFPHCLPSM
jgi:hypothetical protein